MSTVAEDAPAASWSITSILSLAVIPDILLALLVSPFRPAIAHDLDVDRALIGQVPAVATLLATAIGFVGGALADRYGCRHMLEVALCSDVIGSVAAGLSVFGIGTD